MPVVWRLTKQRYARQGFTGLGAHLFGGRWNSKGRPVVYTSVSLALAVLEILVHLPHARHLGDLRAAQVDVPDDLVERVQRLPRSWRTDVRATRRVGDAWIASESSPVLEVPSAVYRCRGDDPGNYLLNPAHPAFARLELHAFRKLDLDPRITQAQE